MNRSAFSDIVLLTFCWLIAIFIIQPTGNFPLNDDWSYAIAVQRLLETGNFRPLGWTSATLLTHTLWGAFFCKIFGYSYTVLRWSTLCAGWLGILGTYVLVKQANQNRNLAILTALCIAFNPLFCLLSFTFMTDIFFFATSVWAMFFYVCFLQNEKKKDLFFAILLTSVAVLCRQLGLFIPLAFMVAALLKKRFKIKEIPITVLPVFITVFVLFIFQFWLKSTGRAPEAYGAYIGRLGQAIQERPGELPQQIAKNSYISFLYLGWFLAPIASCLALTKSAFNWKRYLLIALPVLLFFIIKGTTMPIAENIIQAEGLGPLMLYDVYLEGQANVPAISVIFWKIITCLGILSGLVMLLFLLDKLLGLFTALRQWQFSQTQILNVFFLAAAAIYFFPIMLGGFFDRYLLPLVLLLSLIFCLGWDFTSFASSKGRQKTDKILLRKWDRGRTKKFSIYLSSFLLVVMTFFSIAATHDYLAWNRTRWLAIDELIEKENIPETLIDGGFEFNGSRFYHTNRRNREGARYWWWVEERPYIVTFGALPNTEVLKKYTYQKYLPWSKGEIWVVKR